MNHFMKYESNAENNVEKKVINELAVPAIANRQFTGALGRGQRKFKTGIAGIDELAAQKTASALYQNLKELLANDPDAEKKKLKIVRLVYNWAKAQPLAPQPQNGQQQIPGTF